MWRNTYTFDTLSYIYRHVLNGFKESFFRDLGANMISGSGCHLYGPPKERSEAVEQSLMRQHKRVSENKGYLNLGSL